MAKKLDIKRLRKRLGLTQQGLAERLGIDQGTVSRLEAGSAPSKPVLLLLEMLNA